MKIAESVRKLSHSQINTQTNETDRHVMKIFSFCHNNKRSKIGNKLQVFVEDIGFVHDQMCSCTGSGQTPAMSWSQKEVMAFGVTCHATCSKTRRDKACGC